MNELENCPVAGKKGRSSSMIEQVKICPKKHYRKKRVDGTKIQHQHHLIK